jgi:hypothetical protein
LNANERVSDVQFTDVALSVDLADGRVISVPLLWYPRLYNATPEQRANWELCGAGYGIHWPDLNEDLRLTSWSSSPCFDVVGQIS